MKQPPYLLSMFGLMVAAPLFAQNNTLQGRVLYQSSGNKPAVGVHVKEQDSNGDYSKDNGAYRLSFQTKRNGAALALEVGKDNGRGQKLELVNEKEVKAAKLPASAEEPMDIIVCPAGQRDIAAQRYYRILRTTADRELERMKKEYDAVVAQKEKDFQQLTKLSERITQMQQTLDSAKIREQAFNIASINLDRASQMVKDAVKKIDEENDVDGALKILNAEALDTAYEHASAIKKQGEAIVKKADVEIRQVIEGYEFKASLLEPQFKYGEVAECYEKIAGIYEKEGYDKGQWANYLSNEAIQFGLNGDYQKELYLHLKVLNIREKTLPADHSDLATSYNDLADTYFRLGEYPKQLEFNLKALAIREKILSADDRELSRSYNNLATAYCRLGEYQKSLELQLKDLGILEKILPSNHPDLALSYNNLATVYENLGDYQKRLEYIQKAMEIREKALPADHPLLADSYHSLTLAYSDFGEPQKALEFGLKGLAIREKILRADHPTLAESYNGLAYVYGDLNDHQKALEFNLKTLAIFEKSLPPDHPDLATTLNNLAFTYGNLGEYQKQLEFNLKALAIKEKTLPPDHPNLATGYINLAVNYVSLKEYQKALEFNLKALAILEKSLPPDHPHLVSAYGSLALTYRNLGEYKKSIENSQKAIQIGEASSPKHLGLNRFYANLGITYLKAHQYPEAKTALEKSESLKQEWGVYRGWAMYYALQNKKEHALENLQKAVALGFKDLKWLETEPDLKNIRKEKGYKELVEQLKKQ